MKCAIYARYSSERQRSESIEDQLRICRAYAAENGMEVVREYTDEALSGRTDKRPSFLKMVSDACDMGFQTVVVYKMDRFARDRFDTLLYRRKLEECGVSVVSATESIPEGAEGILVDGMLTAIAEWYSANLSQNVRRGLNGNAMKCKTNGMKLYGYRTGDDGCFEIVESEARLVRQAFDMAPHTSFTDIARWLESKGMRTHFGNPPSYMFVKNMLGNPKYKGTYKFGDTVIEDGMPAIVSKETWAAAQVKRGKKTMKSSGYLLVGKAVCECGGTIHGECATSRNGSRYYYYGCSKCHKRHRMEKLDEAVLELIDTALDEKTRQSVVDRLWEYCKSEYREDARSDCEARIADALKRRKRLVDSIADGIPASAVKEAIDKTSLDEARAREELATLRPMLTREEIAELLDFHISKHRDPMLFVHSVVVFEDAVAVTFNLREQNSPDLKEVRAAIDESGSSSTSMVGNTGFEPVTPAV